MSRVGALNRYAALATWLETLSPEQHRAELSFAAIEALIDGALPASAFNSMYWSSSNVARHNWRRVGFAAHFDRTGPRVVFTRGESRAVPRAGPYRKYAPLVAWLAALPLTQQSASLTVPEIEVICGVRLPASAGLSTYWSSGSTAATNWQWAGWRARLLYGDRRVAFVRVQP
jgi:hypothetical protein